MPPKRGAERGLYRDHFFVKLQSNYGGQEQLKIPCSGPHRHAFHVMMPHKDLSPIYLSKVGASRRNEGSRVPHGESVLLDGTVFRSYT